MAQPELSFRDATAAYIPALLALIQSAYRGEASRKGWTTEADLVEGERIDEAGMLEKLSEPNGAIIIVTTPGEKNAELVACCEILHRSASRGSSAAAAPETTTTPTTTNGSASSSASKPQIGYFGLFAVDPNRQAGGIGRRVLEYAEREASRRWGVQVMEMTVIAARSDIINWYVRRGYAQSTTEPTRPFPYEMVAQMKGGKVLRDDLYFSVLEKVLA